MPYKRAILRSLDWVDPLAKRIGACNTVAVQQGNWMGWNTDAAAVVEVLTKRLRLAGSRILILGAGGAARAAAYAVRAEGAEVVIAARREQSARSLARGVAAQVVPWDSAESLEVDAVINATPVGMYPHVDRAPIDLARLRVRVVFDMVYFPLETRFLHRSARARLDHDHRPRDAGGPRRETIRNLDRPRRSPRADGTGGPLGTRPGRGS